MNVKIEETTNDIKYVVEDVPSQYHDTLKHYFFTQDGKQFVKSYRRDILMFPHNISEIESRFSKHLVEMLEITNGNKSMNWELSLKRIIEILYEKNIKWWLAGSAACAIRGINIKPQDIDIMTYKSEITKIKNAFKNYIIEPFHHINDWIMSGFGVVFVEGRVDIAFDPVESSDDNGRLDFGYYASNNLETIQWKGKQVKVPPVKLHIISNEIRERTERVKLIKEYIEKR